MLIIHFHQLPTMCRVRFGLTGIYFDALEPSRPREETFQPLIASIPLVLQNKHGDAESEAIRGGEVQEKVIVATEIPKNNEENTTKNLSDSSSSSSRDEGWCSTKKVKTNRASVGNKRVRNSVSSSSSSASSSSVSSALSSDEDQIHKLTNAKPNLHAPKPSKLIELPTTQKRHQRSFKRHTSTSPGGLTKTRPAKRVRFAMDEQESITPSHAAGSPSSSHSSDDSYTDPPLPIEPYGADGGYHRTPPAAKSYETNAQIAAGWRMRLPAGVETDVDSYDGLLDSEDGSEVDVQALPVKRRPQRAVQAHTKNLTSGQRRYQNNAAPATWSKQSGRVVDQSCVVAENDESNVDSGLHLEEAHASQDRLVSSRNRLSYPKLRSGKDLPEPIFVIRPKFLSEAKEKRKPAGSLSGGGYGRDIASNRHEGRKAPPSRPTRVKAPNSNVTPKYRRPSVTDDLQGGVEFDESLDMLIRDV